MKWRILVVATTFALVSCRTDSPPVLSIICVTDGLGGGNCSLADGSQKYLAPSEMAGMWATTQTDQANFSAWCYDTTPERADKALEFIKKASLAQEH